ncbi:hypothetical protein X798_01045, partial [Onchocerca flexuosa]
MELNRKSYTRRAASYQHLLSIRDNVMWQLSCNHHSEGDLSKVVTYAARDESYDVDENKFNNVETRKNVCDYCKAILAPMKEQCIEAMLSKCTELIMQTSISRNYNNKLDRTKEIQSNCEKKIMAILKIAAFFLLRTP